jgi:3',5'-cyclic AMP phosphodiesterase CpdA
VTVRIAHLSDIHFGGENVAAVQAALERLHRETLDAVIVTGDLTSFGTIPEFDSAAAWLRTVPQPCLSTAGNHDAPFLGPRELLARLAAPFGRFEARFGPADSAWSGAGLGVALVNTARSIQARANWSKGAISARQVDEAIRALAGRAAGALSVIACHHPLVEMIGGPMTGRVHGGEAAARRFCEARVDVILTGHIHAPFAMPLPYGDGHVYAVGAGTLSLRERGAPPGFNLIEADEAEIRVTALGWKPSGYETWRTWALPRRPATPAAAPSGPGPGA